MVTATQCGTATEIQAVSAGGTGSTAVSAPTVFNYPVQPPRDDGRMMAVSALIGGVLDAVLGGESLGQATDAENTWKGILDNTMTARGQSEITLADTLRGKLPTFETDLANILTDYRSKAAARFSELAAKATDYDIEIADQRAKSDGEWGLKDPYETTLSNSVTVLGNKAVTRYDKLLLKEDDIDVEIADQRTKSSAEWLLKDPYDTVLYEEVIDYGSKSDAEYAAATATCVDEAITKLCQFVDCGYTPDYAGIAARARADAEIANVTKFQEACRTANRYTARRHDSIALDIRLATAGMAIGAAAKGRETERQHTWDTNFKMRTDHAKWLEDVRTNRRKLSLDYDSLRIKVAENRWDSHAKLSFEQDRAAMAALIERGQSYAKTSLEYDSMRDKLADNRWGAHAKLSFDQDAAARNAIDVRWKNIASLYLDQTKMADAVSENRWTAYTESALKSLREGGEMLASAAQAYQFLAASIRQTAKQGGGGGGVAGAIATLAFALPLFSGSCSKAGGPIGALMDFFPRPQNCCGTTPTPTTTTP